MENLKITGRKPFKQQRSTDLFEETLLGLGLLQREGVLCDVTLCGREGVKKVCAHKCLLASKSSYFRAMFTTSMKESTTRTTEVIALSSMRDCVVNDVVVWCYTGHIDVNDNNVEEILDAAHMLGIYVSI